MGAADIGELLALLGIVAIVASVAGLTTGQSAPVDLETVSWAGSIVVTIGIVLILVGN